MDSKGAVTDEPTYLPLDQYRYEMWLRHLVRLAKSQGWYDYATKYSRELAEREPEIFGTLPGELWQFLKEKP